ncbi:hypothetical protein GTP41_25040 [Pseudoduganella sp. DS3]|uniref:Uncharacterized protein n=1 Tax=Pseudoduganella guangdongensis TaxID=2692179 RepID=A0A6N9HPK5_9BURK|nr:hypothetical protein [Pseudoduganella guangdongensis]MYN05369.1 hypothetical protein [Pseudoduganella guangdongensis]
MTITRDAEHQEIWHRLAEHALFSIGAQGEWHWFRYHFSFMPLHPLAKSIVDACADCERVIPGLGEQFIEEIISINGQERHEPHYEQLLQKLSEILVLRQLLSLDWPPDTEFQHEPAAVPNGKRPELRVTTPDERFLFEVKTPSLMAHIRNRNRAGVQIPGRALERERIEAIAANENVTLPRDNPIKDFLVDANEKFRQFKARNEEKSVLIIVWDDFLYEPITALGHERCGLLTPNSYFRDADDNAIEFPHIDAVILIRHLTYLYRATADVPLDERNHALDFGDENSLPNVHFPLNHGLPIPENVLKGLRAVSHTDEVLQRFADYRPKDIVIWA